MVLQPLARTAGAIVGGAGLATDGCACAVDAGSAVGGAYRAFGRVRRFPGLGRAAGSLLPRRFRGHARAGAVRTTSSVERRAACGTFAGWGAAFALCSSALAGLV